MKKIFKILPILLLILLAIFPSTVQSDNLGYYVAGHQFGPLTTDGRGIRGSLMIYQRNFDSWPLNRPQYWIQINMEDALVDNFVEGGLTTYQDFFGSWKLYIFMSVRDNGANPRMIKTEEIPFPTQPYSIELIRNVQNPKLWLMLVQRPGNPGYETWYSYEFANIWSGTRLMSQTEGYHQPSADQDGLHVGEFNNLQWYNDINGWVSWTDCTVYTTTPEWKVNGVSTGVDSWYSYINYPTTTTTSTTTTTFCGTGGVYCGPDFSYIRCCPGYVCSFYKKSITGDVYMCQGPFSGRFRWYSGRPFPMDVTSAAAITVVIAIAAIVMIFIGFKFFAKTKKK